MQEYRTEHDLLGEVRVPAAAPFGAQTQRAIANFPLHGERKFSDYPELLRAMLTIKKACALANERAGLLDRRQAAAIMNCVDTLLADPPVNAFPVHSFHGGGGVSFNMNVNEVVANLANRDGFGTPFGGYVPLHPNDHVNLNQSTNDVFASGCHLAIIERWRLVGEELEALATAFTALGEKYQEVKKISRTCLQDAVEISFGDFLSGYASIINRSTARVTAAVEELHCLTLGGTMVGRPEDAHPAYLQEAIPALREVTGNLRFERTANLFDGSQNLDDMVHVATQLKLLAQGLIKIGKDLRLMASGPQTGFGEIELPATQPGSSAFPGKVNPSVPEFLFQSCFMVIGRCCAAEMALEHGELDLNVWESTVVINILDAMAALQNAAHLMVRDCVAGIAVNRETNERNINTLIPLLTRIKQEKGYSFATRAYKESGGNFKILEAILAEKDRT